MPRFVPRLGLFITWEGMQVDDSDKSHADNWVPLTIVENDIKSSFTHMPVVATLAWQREEYRPNR